MKQTVLTGRYTCVALADEVPAMFRQIARQIEDTPHPIRSLRIAIDENGFGYTQIKWLWWQDEPSRPSYPPMQNNQDGVISFSVPYRNQLGSAFTAAAEWIEAMGATACSIHQDIYSGWWVLTLV